MKQTILFLLLCGIFYFNPLAAQKPGNAVHSMETLQLNQLAAAAITEGFNLRHNGFIGQPDQEAGLTLAPKLLPAPTDGQVSFYSLSFGWNEAGNEAGNTLWEIRFSADGTRWDAWQPVATEAHAEGEPLRYSFVTELLFVPPAQRQYQLRMRTNLLRKGVVPQLLFINCLAPREPGVQAAPLRVGAATPAFRTTCSCAQPQFTSRSGWGCPQAPWNPSVTTPTHLIVHHSAGGNTSSNWDGVVLAIWNHHVNTNGWSDVGYNWLIAPTGQLYEGRQNSSTQNVTGAHFCGFNGRTMGVCMIGTYTSTQITAEARATLIHTLAWKACQLNIDLTGTSLHINSSLTINHVSGHRQGCATECPGATLFSDLTAIQFAAKAFQTSGCVPTPVSQIEELEQLRVVPNPTRGNAVLQLRLRGTQEVRYQIFSNTGQFLYQSPAQQLAGAQAFPLHALQGQPAGVYIVQVWVNQRATMLQVVQE